MSEPLVVVARASRGTEANEILYGLSLRGIRAQVRQSRRADPDPWEVVVPESALGRAKAALPSIWDAVLIVDRAMTPEGRCPFCGYDQRGVPSDRPCPECGIELGSIEARRAYRDGRSPRKA